MSLYNISNTTLRRVAIVSLYLPIVVICMAFAVAREAYGVTKDAVGCWKAR